MQDHDWNDIKIFLALARDGRLDGAAKRLGVNATTVSRRIKALSGQLGGPLFQRIDNGYRLTALGAALLADAEALDTLHHSIAARAGRASAPSGRVPISAVPLVADIYLIPALAPFLAQFPDIAVEIVAEERNADLTRRDADLAIRFARPRAGGLTVQAQRLGALSFGIYSVAAAPARWIGYEPQHADLPQARWLAQKNPRAGVAVGTLASAMAAAASGLGYTLLPDRMAARDKRLIRQEERSEIPSRDVWLLSHKDDRDHPAIEAVKTWISALDWG